MKSRENNFKQEEQTKKTLFEKISTPRNVVFTLVFLITSFLFFYFAVPGLASWIVLKWFQPSGEKLEKIGFVKFKGLVWASTTKERAEEIVKRGPVEISAELINKEYIFDFTFEPRNERQHGYVKKELQFYVKSEIMGEHAIILDPELAFSIFALDVGFLVALLLSVVLSPKYGFMSFLIHKEIGNVITKVKLQTGLDEKIINYLIMPDNELKNIQINDPAESKAVIDAFAVVWERTASEEMASADKANPFEKNFSDTSDLVKFRNEKLYERIKDYFSDFVYKEIIDLKGALEWENNRFLIRKGLRLYMAHHFTEKYSNNVTGLAYIGAAFLIVVVGIRGLKFIPATKPSFILLAIFLEFTMLALLGITMIYTEEEERMDRMLKKMEDANLSQLEVLRTQQFDIHRLAEILVGQSAEIIKSRVEDAISEYLTSDDNIKRMIAEEISRKIILGIKESFTEEN